MRWRWAGVLLLAALGLGCDEDSSSANGHTGDGPEGISSVLCVEGWCWENPRPTAHDYVDLAVLENEAWLVTEGGALIHWTGANYEVENLNQGDQRLGRGR